MRTGQSGLSATIRDRTVACGVPGPIFRVAGDEIPGVPPERPHRCLSLVRQQGNGPVIRQSAPRPRDGPFAYGIHHIEALSCDKNVRVP